MSFFRAHGAMPRPVGSSACALRDADGKALIPVMVDKLRKVGGHLLGVGYDQD